MTSGSRGPTDDGLVKIGGELSVDGVTRGPASPSGRRRSKWARRGSGVGGFPMVRFARSWATPTESGAWPCPLIAVDSLTASHDYTVRLWDVETGRQLLVMSGHTDHVKGVAFLPDGRRGISGADDDTLRLWDLATGRELRRFVGHTADLSAVAVSPDGRRALSSASDRTVRIWDLENGREVGKPKLHASEVTQGDFYARWPPGIVGDR